MKKVFDKIPPIPLFLNYFSIKHSYLFIGHLFFPKKLNVHQQINLMYETLFLTKFLISLHSLVILFTFQLVSINMNFKSFDLH